MNDQDKLDALTNQRVEITLGNKTYLARRATVGDLPRMIRYIKQKGGDYQDLADNFEASLYLLSELIKPDVNLTPEELGDSIPFAQMDQVNQAMAKVGFTAPQLPAQMTR